jgi:hypothetical protein
MHYVAPAVSYGFSKALSCVIQLVFIPVTNTISSLGSIMKMCTGTLLDSAGNVLRFSFKLMLGPLVVLLH